MTHFGLICPASTGHLNTMLPLGQELQRRGHRVTLFGILDAQPKTLAAGLEFWAIGESEFPAGVITQSLARLGEMNGLAALKYTVNLLKGSADIMARFINADSSGKRSRKPRFKSESSFKTMTFSTAKDEGIKLVRKNWLYLRLPKLGEDLKVPEFTPDKIIPTWENSMGLDAVLYEDVYLATSEGEKLPSLKPLRKNQDKLDRISQKRNARKRGSRRRRKLAKREAKQHQKIARSRQDFHYKTAHKIVRGGKKVFFHEDLNLKGLTKRNQVKQDETRKFLPNGQSAKSGLNKSWLDAAFGNFFKTLDYIAEKAGAVVIAQKPAYSTMILCYRNEGNLKYPYRALRSPRYSRYSDLALGVCHYDQQIRFY